MRRCGKTLISGNMIIYYGAKSPFKNSSSQGQKNCAAGRAEAGAKDRASGPPDRPAVALSWATGSPMHIRRALCSPDRMSRGPTIGLDRRTLESIVRYAPYPANKTRIFPVSNDKRSAPPKQRRDWICFSFTRLRANAHKYSMKC